MPIDWGTALGGIDDSTAAILAERDTIANLLLKQAQMGSLNETRKSQAQLRKAQAEEINARAADKLTQTMIPGQLLAPGQGDTLRKANRGHLVAQDPGQLPSGHLEGAGLMGAVPQDVPSMGDEPVVGPVDTPQATGPIAEVHDPGFAAGEVYTGDPREMARRAAIEAYIGEPDETKKQMLGQKLQLDYNIKQGVFGGQQHLYTVDPATGGVQDLGAVPANSKVITKTAANSGSAGVALPEGPALTSAVNYYIATGKVPFSLGRGGIGGPAGISFMNAVNDEYAARAKAGIASGDMASAKANLDALSKSLTKRQDFFRSVSAAQEAAEKNIDLAIEAGKNVQRPVGSTWMNKKILDATRSWTEHPDLADFDLKVYTAIREYAKVSTGSSNSVAELSAAAVKQAEALFSVAQSGETFEAAAEAMKQDMNSIVVAQHDQITKIQSEIKDITSPRTATAAGAAGGVTPAPLRVAAKVGEWRLLNGAPHQWNGTTWVPGQSKTATGGK